MAATEHTLDLDLNNPNLQPSVHMHRLRRYHISPAAKKGKLNPTQQVQRQNETKNNRRCNLNRRRRDESSSAVYNS
ncbi:unnamed protein product [Colias eurytheme]|nr:unnamed protein product [Colias eurytheme]